MTEKEKAAAGMLYDANYDEELAKERLACKDLCAEYNQLKPSDVEMRKSLMKKLLGKTGDTFWIEQWETRRFVYECKQLQFLTQFTVITTFCFFQFE